METCFRISWCFNMPETSKNERGCALLIPESPQRRHSLNPQKTSNLRGDRDTLTGYFSIRWTWSFLKHSVCIFQKNKTKPVATTTMVWSVTDTKWSTLVLRGKMLKFFTPFTVQFSINSHVPFCYSYHFISIKVQNVLKKLLYHFSSSWCYLMKCNYQSWVFWGKTNYLGASTSRLRVSMTIPGLLPTTGYKQTGHTTQSSMSFFIPTIMLYICICIFFDWHQLLDSVWLILRGKKPK